MKQSKEKLDSTFFPESFNRQTQYEPAATAAIQAVVYHARQIAAFHQTDGWKVVTFDFWHNGQDVVGVLQGEQNGETMVLKDIAIAPGPSLQAYFFQTRLNLKFEFLEQGKAPLVMVTGHQRTDNELPPGCA